ncbi:MAG: hypothetical protein IPK28_19305 [Devosia sp.]|nr:hypothetical protein [Devosia sp.]
MTRCRVLHEAFARAGHWRSDPQLRDAFLSFLSTEYYVGWPATSAAQRQRLGAQVRTRLSGRVTDWEDPASETPAGAAPG